MVHDQLSPQILVEFKSNSDGKLSWELLPLGFVLCHSDKVGMKEALRESKIT